MNEIFSDYFAQRKNLLTALDARVKMVFALGAIIAVLSSDTPCVSLAVIILVTVGLFALKIPFKVIAARTSAPLGIAVTLLVVKIFFYHESFDSALTMTSKIVGSTSLVLFLSMTTRLDKLLAACRWFKVPGIWVEISLIAYRYIFVLLEDATTVFNAQKVRLGYANPRKAMRSLGTLAGAVVVRAYDQSVATYEAMMLRGYKG